jgi:hypothetical protein
VSYKGDRTAFVRDLEDKVGKEAAYESMSNRYDSPAAIGNQEDDKVGDEAVDKRISNKSDSTAVISN